MRGDIIRPSDVHAPRGYNHAIRAGDTVYVAGQVALDTRGQLVGKDDITAQADQVFRNLKAVLQGAGGSMAHVVKLTTYLTRQQDVGTVVGIRRAQFAEEPPATTLVIVAGLANPDYLIEVEAVAVLG